MAGFRGEQSLDYPLSYLPKDDFFIFHDLRLFDGHHHFQIDFLILCSRFALILEVKNIIGKLTFDTDLNQLIREVDDSTDVFDDPILQAENLNMQLLDWLERYYGISIPIVDRVVIASSAQLQVTDLKNDRIKKIVRRAKLKAELLQVNQQFSKDYVSYESLKKVADALLANHQTRVIKKFTTKLKPNDIIKGVQCPNCDTVPILKMKQKWVCNCGHASRNTHLAALRDYFLIYGPEITNQKCRDFLLLKSELTARRLLHTLCDYFEGKNKARIYYLSRDILHEN
nr:nuclease-related domain-containing protein [Sporolactobacillus kofuensis]